MNNDLIKKVIVIFKTHLDIGFTDFSDRVTKKYMEEFIPNALAVAKKLRVSNSKSRLKWTTGSWLISEYLRTHGGKEKDEFIQGILNGDICWHGLPFTTHTELMSAELFKYGLSISQNLDKDFDKKTIAAKLTDVPGHTKAIIPFLKEAGIEFLHIGVNPASAVPEVPPIFKWKADSGEMITVMYQMDYGEFTHIGDSDTAVFFAHTGDNIGVQSAEDIEIIFDELKQKMPYAEIIAGDLNDLALAVKKIEDTLPIIDFEIGDTWIHGVGTDPKKVSQFRALQRLYEQLPSGEDKEALARGLIMIPEHTWGLDVKTHLKDHNHYDKTSLSKVRNTCENYIKMEKSWQEQRKYLYSSVDKLILENQIKASEYLAEAVRQEATTIDMNEYEIGNILTLNDYKIRFNQNGEIDFLCKGDNVIADERHRLISIFYEQFSNDDYKRFYDQYNRLDVEWAREDFTKPGMEAVAQKKYTFKPQNVKIYYDIEHIVVKYNFEETAYTNCGCPKFFDIVIRENHKGLHFDLAWFDKTANRVAEAIWVGFNPVATNKKISKLSNLIDIRKIVDKGQCRLHATDKGVFYSDLAIETIDTALVSPFSPSLLDFNDIKSCNDGVYFNLYNNVWGTNFPMWYDEDARFRFNLVIDF